MKVTNKLKAVSMGVGAVLMMGAGQTAFAHASILNAINSGATGFSRVGVNHAINHTTPPTPVVAQSVVFPTVNPILGRFDPLTAIPAIPAIPATATTPAVPAVPAVPPVALPIAGLGDFFATSAAGATTTGLLPWVTVAGAPQLIQSKDIFAQQIEQANPANATIGWVSTKGLLQVNLNGEVPFRFAAPHFRSILPAANPNGLTTADLCVNKLVISVAVADIANPNPQPPFVAANPTGLPGSETSGIGYNLWLDNLTPGLAASAFPPQVTENGAATTNLTINRDPVVNPYPANCAPAGPDPVLTITIKPSAADINALQFPGWGAGITPAAGANGNVFR